MAGAESVNVPLRVNVWTMSCDAPESCTTLSPPSAAAPTGRSGSRNEVSDGVEKTSWSFFATTRTKYVRPAG